MRKAKTKTKGQMLMVVNRHAFYQLDGRQAGTTPLLPCGGAHLR
jgi:hypothetical protein